MIYHAENKEKQIFWIPLFLNKNSFFRILSLSSINALRTEKEFRFGTFC